jgi:hypothetical protein
MNSQQTSQKEQPEAAASSWAAAESRSGSRQDADSYAMTQAARAVMQPDRHDLEWRFYHGAVCS